MVDRNKKGMAKLSSKDKGLLKKDAKLDAKMSKAALAADIKKDKKEFRKK